MKGEKNMLEQDCKKTCRGKCVDENGEKECRECFISTETSSHTRRCFMTGEYCSQKTNIQRERDKLYRNKKDGKIDISAFVIMNFSDMSDVIYKWRIEPFIKSLNKYLYMDTNTKKLYCYTDKRNIPKNDDMKNVDKIRVIRSDSDPASNYVICNRICQQMQIADLIIVDVSTQNPNVFYEFGMAVALDKLILPICFSESFYKIEYPPNIKEMKKGKNEDKEKTSKARKILEHHIGCYPWRKNLFEYYGIRYKRDPIVDRNGTRYLDYYVATNEDYGFSDKQYKRFPYDAELVGFSDNENIYKAEEADSTLTNGEIPNEDERQKDNEKIGKVLYNKLLNQYNNATSKDNTLVVYTMERFLNEDEAGRCIVNFYHSITERMQNEQCFRGERVGVLVQGNVIPENDKDASEQRNLLYNVGEIIHIGVNQATYLAMKEKVESEDVLKDSQKNPDIFEKDNEGLSIEFKKEIIRTVKSHIGNRGMIIYPDNPVYVDRIKNLMPDNILASGNAGCYPLNAFCLYHIMLKTLCYTNEIVVDISNNNLHSLFWLGAAHGSEINAITVKQELSDKEREIITGSLEDRNRNVFDVAGLWTAFYYSHDTEGFYHQLALAQFGIEKNSKIIPSNVVWHGFKRMDYLESDEQEELEQKETTDDKNKEENQKEKEQLKEKKLALESYYRRRFWNAMLRYNRLRIYLSQHDNENRNNELRAHATKWDLDAVSSLTHYLSKRSVIGDYLVITLPKGKPDDRVESVNFICVGQPVSPLGENLSDYIYQKFKINKDETNRDETNNDIYMNINKIHVYDEKDNNISDCTAEKTYILDKGFKELGSENEDGIYRVFPWAKCLECCNMDQSSREEKSCRLKDANFHTEIAQLILWREDETGEEINNHFRVSIVGSSGPATFGLSSLFVDEGQKLDDFLKDQNEISYDDHDMLLYDLQASVREKIYKLLMEQLKNRIDAILYETEGKDPNDKQEKKRLNRYRNLVLYAIYAYLSTVFYRYFFPFLTEKDIDRIHNGIYLFLNSMKAAKQSPFCINYEADPDKKIYAEVKDDSVNRIIEVIPIEIKEFLNRFKGLEAFYEVKVEIEKTSEDKEIDEKKDLRTVKEIKALENKDEAINFFIIPPPEKGEKHEEEITN